jgi:hypothetical protein
VVYGSRLQCPRENTGLPAGPEATGSERTLSTGTGVRAYREPPDPRDHDVPLKGERTVSGISCNHRDGDFQKDLPEGDWDLAVCTFSLIHALFHILSVSMIQFLKWLDTIMFPAGFTGTIYSRPHWIPDKQIP